MDEIMNRRNQRRIDAVRASGINEKRLARIVGGEGIGMKGQNVRLPEGMDERIDAIVAQCEQDREVARLVLGYGALINRSAVLRSMLDRGATALEAELSRRRDASDLLQQSEVIG